VPAVVVVVLVPEEPENIQIRKRMSRAIPPTPSSMRIESELPEEDEARLAPQCRQLLTCPGLR
jgi:hypothetical protein